MTFLNIALLGGLAAGAIPIIIHLFHKSRFKVVKWGAMHLLEAVLRTNQRRVKIEQWILLAIRTAIPLLLALAMARPLWTGASKLLGDAKSSTVVLLDNSYSMEAARAGTSTWSIARNETQHVLGDLKNGSDAFVMLMGQGGAGVIDTPTVDISQLSQQLGKTNAGFGAARIPGALDLAASTLEKMREPVRQVVMMTDFQRVSFEATETQLLTTALDRLKKQTIPPSIVFWDVGQDVKENVAIESLDFSRLMIGVGQKIQIRVNLRNYGDANHPDLRVTLKVDGKDKAVSQVNLGPRAKGQVLFTQSFEAAGSHVVEVATEPDALAADNTFLASIPVRDRLPVLLVDGAPGATPDDMKSETAYLQIALSPFASGKVELSDLVAARAIPLEALNAKAISESQVVVLANVRSLGNDQVKALEDFVKTGGGLLIFPGDKTDANWWNTAFAKLAPLPIGGVAGDLKEGAPSMGVTQERYQNAALELFNDPRNGSLGDVAVKVWFKLKAPEQKGGLNDPVVLARLDSGDPFLAEKTFGKGQVIMCATACDADWSNMPARPSYLPLMQRLCVYLASNVYPPRNLDIGQNLVSFLPPDTAGRNAIVTGPDGVPRDVKVVSRDDRGVVEFGPVNVPGLYTVLPPGGTPLHYVFNADRKESDLERLTENEVTELARANDIPVVRTGAEFRALEHKQRYGTEMWKWVLWALLFLIFLELILQQWFAKRRGKLVIPVKPDVIREMAGGAR